MSKKKSDRNLIVGLDIGTSKVVALVGEIKSDNSIEIIGFGSHPLTLSPPSHPFNEQ